MIGKILNELKVSDKYPHHYLISVGITSIKHKDPGKYFLKHGPLYFHNKDVENLQNVLISASDELIKTKLKDSLHIYNCNELVQSINGLILAANVNNCNLYHFSTEEYLDDSEWFSIFIKSCNTSNSNKEILNNARIR